jgi:phosphatidylethanolamine/phosphatidyl-N-methylethanolamine N-methyltransferase
MSLKFSYTLLAPIYDSMVSSSTETMRSESLKRLKLFKNRKILINGIGSGLDIPFLPSSHDYTGTDITPSMLSKARKRAENSNVNIKLDEADVMKLPYEEDSFDIVLMHLILAVVPHPLKALQEASRVLKPGGKIFILDKFLRPGQLALTRRILNVFIKHLATRTDVVFEHLHDECTELKLITDIPVSMSGWFRSIELQKEIAK